MKNKNERTYYVQSQNPHLMNALEKEYFIEVGVIDHRVMNRLLKGEKINLTDIVDLELLSEGLGAITGDKINDIYYQLNYLINLRQKNSTMKFLLTAGIIKIHDDDCEKFAPVVFIPFEFDYRHMTITSTSSPMINTKLVKYVKSKTSNIYTEDKKLLFLDSERHFEESYLNRKLSNFYDIDKVCLDLASELKTTVDPMNYFTVAFVEYKDIVIEKDSLSVNRSINEMSEQAILKKYYKNIYEVLPTNIDQKHVILKVNDGEKFAVDGKLGSGKTYTIINIIADAIRKGKKVLYVNQDLDNIFDLDRNLTYLGLNSYTYNLTKTIRDFEKEELNFSINYKQTPNIDIIDKLFVLPTALSSRVHGYKIQEIFESIATIKQVDKNIKTIPLATILERHEANKIYSDLLQIEDELKKIDLYANNIWHRLQTAYNNISSQDIVKRLESLCQSQNDIDKYIKTFIKKYNFKMPRNINEVYRLVADIYSFASIRPLPSWIEQTTRSEVLTYLKEIQNLVDINYSITKYYESTISKSYIPGRISEIMNTIKGDFLVIDENYESTDAIFINRLIAFDDKISILTREIDSNVQLIRTIKSNVLKTFNLKKLDDEAYNFLITFGSFIANNRFDIDFYESYATNHASFSKCGEVILAHYDTYQQTRKEILPYIIVNESILYNIISQNIDSKRLIRIITKQINSRLCRQNQIDQKELANKIIKYYDAIHTIKNNLTTLFGRKDFDDDYIKNFISFYKYVTSLNYHEKEYFRTFFSKLFSQHDKESYIKNIGKMLFDFKKEGYHTTTICTILQKFNINIINGNVFEKSEKLYIWNYYLKEVDTLKDEIKQIYKNHKQVTFDDIVLLMKNDEQYKNVRKTLDENTVKYNKVLGKYYHGLDTIINEIGRTIEHYNEFLSTLNDTSITTWLFKDDNFDSLLNDTKKLDNLSIAWNATFRLFASCFKGGQPALLTNSFEDNNKQLRQFSKKVDQIDSILNINTLTNGFLDFNLKDLCEGIRSCKYSSNIARYFIYSVYVQNYKEALKEYPVLNSFKDEIAKITEYEYFETCYCKENLDYLKANRNFESKNLALAKIIDFNNYNKIVSELYNSVNVFLCDLDIFNSNIDLSKFDIVLVDDVHLSTSNKYNRITECKQVVAFGDKLFQTSVSNALMRRLGDGCICPYHHRYVKSSAKFNNAWSVDNQYIYSLDEKCQIVMADNFGDFIDNVYQKFVQNPTKIINIVIGDEETRRKIYTSFVKLLSKELIADDVIGALTYNIRILNAFTEGNRYVNEVVIYYDDFVKCDDLEKARIFKNFIVAHNGVTVYFIKDRHEAENKRKNDEIENWTKQAKFDIIETGGIVKSLKEALIKKDINPEVGFGKFDLIIKTKKSIGIMIIGKETDNLTSYLDDFIYYHDEYSKRGWNVIVVYILDLFTSFNNVVNNIVTEATKDE